MTVSPLFKGATRPACIGGVPIKPFVANIGVCMLLGLYIWIPLILICPLIHFVMSRLAAKDDQIFSQMFSYFLLNIKGNRNRFFWDKVTSYSPRQSSSALVVLPKKE